MNLGVDYYPEHWDHSMLEADLDRIVEMGCNTIRIGEFAWHLMEREEGKFDFSFFDHVIERAKERNLQVIFGTPTATFPAWLAKKYPEILSKDENLLPRHFGGRRQYCYNSDVYQQYSDRISMEVIKHYANEEAIILWQIDNELGHEGSDLCYCETCHSKFQIYLSEKYENIDALNKEWGTIFWGQTYNDFTEIPLPLKTITVHNPALLLNFYQFKSDSLVNFGQNQLRILRELAGKNQKVTTNLPGGFFGKFFKHEDLVKGMDFTSYDNYPVWGGLREPVKPFELTASLDYVRGLQRQNFWIVEQLMGPQGHDIIGYLPRPNQAKMWSYHAMANGCESLLYFRYRGAVVGAEQYCYGIIDQDNKPNRKYEEVKSFFHDIKQYSDILKTPVKAEVAFLYDFDNVWAWNAQRQSESFDFNREFLRVYEAFHEKNVKMDIISTENDFSMYKVVVLPVMTLISEKLAKDVKEFAANGGTVIFTFRSAIKDKANNLIFGEKPPCLVSDLVGIEIHESESLFNDQYITVTDGTNTFTGDVWRDIAEVTTATSIYNYADTFYNQYTAASVNEYGEGQAYYIAAGLEYKALEPIVADICARHDLKVIESPSGVEIITRGEGEQQITFIVNHTGQEQVFENITLQPYETVIK